MRSIKLEKIMRLNGRIASGQWVRVFLCVCLAVSTVASAWQVSADEPQKVDSISAIKPLLSDRCFHCHGPDRNSEDAKENDLRLDIRDEAVQHAFEPGNSANSETLRRIMSDDPDEMMPPPRSMMPPPRSTKPRLTKEQVSIFKRWIDEGAEYSEHWSFIPLERPELPTVGKASLKMDAVDTFVNRRLKAEAVDPIAQVEAKPGRDRNPNAFTTWFADGGVKGGVSYGETDELGLNATVDKVSIHDLHATILHQLGIDHEQLSYGINGLDVKLTGVEPARVIDQIIS